MGLTAQKARMILLTGRLKSNSVVGNRISKQGFTLLELIIVSVIILILITVSVPLYRRTYEGLKTTFYVKDITRMMNFCRERAVFERRHYRFVIDQEDNTYRILAEDEESGRFKPSEDRWGRVFKVPEDISIISAQQEINFMPSGVSDSAVIHITSKENKTHSISLDGSTGSIKYYDKTK
jgi:prepilin-type N-terminal cleavage/methylation domain-containing protein